MVTYSVILPPGWSQLDLRDGPKPAADRFAAMVARQAPFSRQPEVRQLAQQHFEPIARDLAEREIDCVILSVAPSAHEPVRPFATVSQLQISDDLEPLMMVQALLGDDSEAQLLDHPDYTVIRTDGTASADDAAAVAQPLLDRVVAGRAQEGLPSAAPVTGASSRLVSSRVRYIIGDVTSKSRWLDVLLAVDHPDDATSTELAVAQIDLFDAVISTLRWES